MRDAGSSRRFAQVEAGSNGSDQANFEAISLGGLTSQWRGMPSMSNAVAVTDATFEQEVEKHDGLAVVDFWATWCGPCRIISPILDQLSAEYEGRVKISKMDVDANIKTASRFNVRSIPMLLFFKNGKVVDQIIGAVPKKMIQSKFEQHAPLAQSAPRP